MFDGFVHRLPFIRAISNFLRNFSEMGLGISVERDPSQFSRALLMHERNLDEYGNAVEIFCKILMWKEVAKKHILLYDLIVNSPDTLLLKENVLDNR